MYFVARLMKSENFRTQHPLCSVSTMAMCMLIKLTYSVTDIVGVGRGPVRPQHGRSMGTPHYSHNPGISSASKKDAGVMKCHCALQVLDCISPTAVL